MYLSSQNRIKRDSELNHFLLIYMRRLSALSQMILSARYWVNISNDKYIEAKEAEWNDYRAAVTQWEIDEYLYKF